MSNKIVNLKSRMKKILALLFLTTLTIIACKKDRSNTDKYITLRYEQTYCADSWATGENRDFLLKSITNYLKSEGLYVASVNIKQEREPEICLACSCKTGKTIYVTTLDSEDVKARYLELGFKP